MPYEIKQISPRKYETINIKTGVIHAKHTSLKKAKAQIRLLHSLEGLEKGGGFISDKFNEDIKNSNNPIVQLPIYNKVNMELPKYFMFRVADYKRHNKKTDITTQSPHWKLADPTTISRNLSTRLKKKSIQLHKSNNTETPIMTNNSDIALPHLNYFSKSDRNKIIEFFGDIHPFLPSLSKIKLTKVKLPSEMSSISDITTPKSFINAEDIPDTPKHIPKLNKKQQKQDIEQLFIHNPENMQSHDIRIPTTPVIKPPKIKRKIIPKKILLKLRNEEPLEKITTPKITTPKIRKKSIAELLIEPSNLDLYKKSVSQLKQVLQQLLDKFKYFMSLHNMHKPQLIQHIVQLRDEELSGKGIFDNIKKVFNKSVSFANKLIGTTEAYPPSLTSIQNKYGNELITKIDVCRNPVPSTITTAMNAVSFGGFNKILKTEPYDKLFHLFLKITTNISSFIIEKNERINASTTIPKITESMNVIFSNGLTFNQLIQNTRNYMGNRFLQYDPSTNNCQDFVLAILQSNNILTDELKQFIKQDTSQIFKSNPNLGKISKGLTDIGAKINIIQQGGSINLKNKKNNNNIYNNMELNLNHLTPQSESQLRSTLGIPHLIMRGGKLNLKGILNTIRNLPNQAKQSVVSHITDLANQSHIPQSTQQITDLANMAQIPTDISGVKRYGKVGLGYALPALGSAIGSAIGENYGPAGSIAGSTVGNILGKISSEQVNKAIGSGLMKKRGRPRKISGGNLLDKPFTARQGIHLIKSLPSQIAGVKKDINGSGMFGCGGNLLDKPFTARQGIHLIKSLPSQIEGVKKDINGSGFKKGSPEMREKMRKLREMRKKK